MTEIDSLHNLDESETNMELFESGDDNSIDDTTTKSSGTLTNEPCLLNMIRTHPRGFLVILLVVFSLLILSTILAIVSRTQYTERRTAKCDYVNETGMAKQEQSVRNSTVCGNQWNKTPPLSHEPICQFPLCSGEVPSAYMKCQLLEPGNYSLECSLGPRVSITRLCQGDLTSLMSNTFHFVLFCDNQTAGKNCTRNFSDKECYRFHTQSDGRSVVILDVDNSCLRNGGFLAIWYHSF